MEKYKAELRSAVNAANRHADTAILKYESAKSENRALSKKVGELTNELNNIKARRAEIQRQRKHAPISYINQLHNDHRLQEKQQRKQVDGGENLKCRSGKENSFIG